jgi:hypothetical protein
MNARRCAIARSVGRIGLLRDNPFELQPAHMFIERLAAPDLVIAEFQG